MDDPPNPTTPGDPHDADELRFVHPPITSYYTKVNLINRLLGQMQRFPSAKTMLNRGRAQQKTSAELWRDVYEVGDDSGPGSYGILAQFKAETLNRFVERYGVESVIEFGCGDGNQLTLAKYPRYLGLDVAPNAIERCLRRFESDDGKSFSTYDPFLFRDSAAFLRAEAALSLDVVYHLLEDAVFELHMAHLFAAATRFVVIYAPDKDGPAPHQSVRWRHFSCWISEHRPDYRLVEHIINPHQDHSAFTAGFVPDFYIFQRIT